jgi:hypothetical protein
VAANVLLRCDHHPILAPDVVSFEGARQKLLCNLAPGEYGCRKSLNPSDAIGAATATVAVPDVTPLLMLLFDSIIHRLFW